MSRGNGNGNGKRRPSRPAVPDVGRPPALTADFEKKFLKLLRDGNLPEVAARACGVGHRTYYDWMAAGKADADSYHATFRKLVLQARAQALADRVSTLAKASNKGNVQAAMFYLERMDPLHWGRKDKLLLESAVRQDDLLVLMRQMAGAVQDNVTDPKALMRIKAAWLAILAQHYPEAVATAAGQIDRPQLPDVSGDILEADAADDTDGAAADPASDPPADPPV